MYRNPGIAAHPTIRVHAGDRDVCFPPERGTGLAWSRRSADSQEQTYNLANFMRTLALPAEVEHWSLTTLREKLIKIGAKVVRHGAILPARRK